MPGVRRLSASEQPGLPDLLARIAGEDERVDAQPAEQTRRDLARLMAQLGPALAASAHRAGAAAVASGRWLADVVVDAAPRLPVRDLATLRRHHAGLDGEQLADVLVRNAVRTTTAIGAGGGALSTAKWFLPGTLLTVPVQLAVETAAVAAVEIKLVGELHEVYGVPVAGTPTQRGTAYALAWANRRGVNPLEPATMTTAMGLVARQRVQRRLLGSAGRGLGAVAPMMIGAVYGARSNRKQTHALADLLRGDLRRHRPLTGGWAGSVVSRMLAPAASPQPDAVPARQLPTQLSTQPPSQPAVVGAQTQATAVGAQRVGRPLPRRRWRRRLPRA